MLHPMSFQKEMRPQTRKIASWIVFVAPGLYSRLRDDMRQAISCFARALSTWSLLNSSAGALGRRDDGLVLLYGPLNAIGASAKILYCCDRGFALSSSLISCSELFPMSSRGRIITRMNRLGRSAAACANTGSGPLSYQAAPGP